MFPNETIVGVLAFLNRQKICELQQISAVFNEIICTHFNNKPPYHMLKWVDIGTNELLVRTFEPIDNDKSIHPRLRKYVHKFNGVSEQTLSTLSAPFIRSFGTRIFCESYDEDLIQILNSIRHIWNGFKVQIGVKNFFSSFGHSSLSKFNQLMEGCARLHCVLSVLPNCFPLNALECNSIGICTYSENFPLVQLLEWLKMGNINTATNAWMRNAKAKFLYLDSSSRFNFTQIRHLIEEDFLRPTSKPLLLPFVIKYSGLTAEKYEEIPSKKIYPINSFGEFLFLIKLEDFSAIIGQMIQIGDIETLIEEVQNSLCIN